MFILDQQRLPVGALIFGLDFYSLTRWSFHIFDLRRTGSCHVSSATSMAWFVAFRSQGSFNGNTMRNGITRFTCIMIFPIQATPPSSARTMISGCHLANQQESVVSGSRVRDQAAD